METRRFILYLLCSFILLTTLLPISTAMVSSEGEPSSVETNGFDLKDGKLTYSYNHYNRYNQTSERSRGRSFNISMEENIDLNSSNGLISLNNTMKVKSSQMRQWNKTNTFKPDDKFFYFHRDQYFREAGRITNDSTWYSKDLNATNMMVNQSSYPFGNAIGVIYAGNFTFGFSLLGLILDQQSDQNSSFLIPPTANVTDDLGDGWYINHTSSYKGLETVVAIKNNPNATKYDWYTAQAVYLKNTGLLVDYTIDARSQLTEVVFHTERHLENGLNLVPGYSDPSEQTQEESGIEQVSDTIQMPYPGIITFVLILAIYPLIRIKSKYK